VSIHNPDGDVSALSLVTPRTLLLAAHEFLVHMQIMQVLATNGPMYVAFHLQDVGALDKEVAEPIETRQKEHEDFY